MLACWLRGRSGEVAALKACFRDLDPAKAGGEVWRSGEVLEATEQILGTQEPEPHVLLRRPARERVPHGLALFRGVRFEVLELHELREPAPDGGVGHGERLPNGTS